MNTKLHTFLARLTGVVLALAFAAMLFAMVSSVMTKANADFGFVSIEMQECISEMERAHSLAEYARELGYPEDDPIILSASRHWWDAFDRYEHLEQENTQEEYAVARYVWDYLRLQGFSDAVITGIIGNMMSECGGQTLDLQPYVWNGSGHYGLCQWSSRFYPQAADQDIDCQLQVLMDTIASTIREAGGSYEYFLTISNPYDAAYYFEKYYERGGWAAIRGVNAQIAYEYFTGRG